MSEQQNEGRAAKGNFMITADVPEHILRPHFTLQIWRNFVCRARCREARAAQAKAQPEGSRTPTSSLLLQLISRYQLGGGEQPTQK